MKQKLKTKRGAMKRFRITGSGKVRFGRANRRHYNTSRSAKQMRQTRRDGVLCSSDAKLVIRMLTA